MSKGPSAPPAGWRIFDKYKICHTDGTPLHGKRYFVLRLDSDDPKEAARVEAAMAAYNGKTARETRSLCLALRDTLYMAARYIQKTPARETVIFNPKTCRAVRTIDYLKTLKKGKAMLKKHGVDCV